MYMPEQSIMATLQRQASLAETLTAGDEKDEKKFRKELKDITPEYRNIISEYLKS
jgi:predicted ATPase